MQRLVHSEWDATSDQQDVVIHPIKRRLHFNDYEQRHISDVDGNTDIREKFKKKKNCLCPNGLFYSRTVALALSCRIPKITTAAA